MLVLIDSHEVFWKWFPVDDNPCREASMSEHCAGIAPGLYVARRERRAESVARVLKFCGSRCGSTLYDRRQSGMGHLSDRSLPRDRMFLALRVRPKGFTLSTTSFLCFSQMPPKRTQSKRKISDSDGDDKEINAKKSKVASPGPSPDNAQPTNTVLPVHISFPPKIPGTLRLATWNVCGLAASQKKVYYSLSFDTRSTHASISRVSNIMWKRRTPIS